MTGPSAWHLEQPASAGGAGTGSAGVGAAFSERQARGCLEGRQLVRKVRATQVCLDRGVSVLKCIS